MNTFISVLLIFGCCFFDPILIFTIFLLFQSSPPQMSPQGREQDIDAIVKVIDKAEKFVHISVMDFIPMSLYTPKPK